MREPAVTKRPITPAQSSLVEKDKIIDWWLGGALEAQRRHEISPLPFDRPGGPDFSWKEGKISSPKGRRELRKHKGRYEWRDRDEELLGIEDFWQDHQRKRDQPDREHRTALRVMAKNERHPDQPREISDSQVWRDAIGKRIPRAAFIDQVTRRRVQREQSDAIVARLERCGIAGRTERGDVTFVDLITGEAERTTDYRNTNFIPVQQSRNVHSMHSAVQYFCDTAKPHSLRMFVISAGWVPIDDLRTVHCDHTRRMSKFRKAAADRYGIRIGYYNVENTIQRTDDGVAMLNVHSHALAEMDRKLPAHQWREFLDWARSFFPKGYFHDSAIRNAREVVKYVFKPSEFELLTDAEFADLYWQIAGRPKEETGEDRDQGPLKFFHPLGRLRSLRASLKRQRRKLIRSEVSPGRWEWRTTEMRQNGSKQDSRSQGRSENVVVAITAPLPLFSPERRPCLIVQGWNGDFAELIKTNDLAELQTEARHIYERRLHQDADPSSPSPEMPAGDGPFIKDTTTTSVRAEARHKMWDWADEPPNGNGRARMDPPAAKIATISTSGSCQN